MPKPMQNFFVYRRNDFTLYPKMGFLKRPEYGPLEQWRGRAAADL